MTTPYKKTATFIKSMSTVSAARNARLYRLSEPLEGTPYVVVSAVEDRAYNLNETYIFRADAEGNIEQWLELPGSYKSSTDHAEALRRAGYTIVEADSEGGGK